MDAAISPLLTDLYQLTMLDAYLAAGEDRTATFELFVRRLPERRGFLLAAGLAQALDWLEAVRFSEFELAWLEAAGVVSSALIDRLASFRFTGDVDAVPEGRVVFGEEPILRVTAPLHEAQFVESRLINLIHDQTLVASKAARMRLAAPGKTLMDFGLRRAHGAEAGLMAARAAWLAGFDGTATVLAGLRFGIPLAGTMAHSFVQVFDDEAVAFEAFARARPQNLTLLIDTYDTLAAARKLVTLSPKLAAAGAQLGAVRIDSGDLVALSRAVRSIFDAGGLANVRIFVSGGLDEDDLLTFERAGAPIDGYGLGTALATSSDAPSLDCAYKLESYAGVPRRKRSEGKASWPGAKQVWRRYGAHGRMVGDVIALDGEAGEGESLLVPVMRDGRRLEPQPALAESRALAAQELARLPAPLVALERHDYPVEIAPSVRRLADEVDRRLGLKGAGA